MESLERLDISGRKDGPRHLIQINDKAVYLTASLFKMLAILALERVRKNGDGWVDTSELQHPAGNAARYMYPLREAINEGLGLTGDDRWEVAEGDKAGHYRLLAPPDKIEFSDLPALDSFGDHAITKRLRGPGRVL